MEPKTHSLEDGWLSWVFLDVEGNKDYCKVSLFSGTPITVMRILGGLLGFWFVRSDRAEYTTYSQIQNQLLYRPWNMLFPSSHIF